MSVIRPDFLKVLPADIDRLGRKLRDQNPRGGLHEENALVAAIIVAAVRYATQLPNGAGRLVLDGHVWWQATQAEIGRSVGLMHAKDRYRVMRIVEKLQAAGELMVCWPTASEDRTKAYRLPDQQGPEQPMCGNARAVSSQCAETEGQCAETDHSMCGNAHCTTSFKELREGEKRVAAPARTSPGPPQTLKDPPPKKFNRPKTDTKALGDLLTDPRARSAKQRRPPEPQQSSLSPRAQAAIKAARANLDRATQLNKRHLEERQEKEREA